jgi:HSP20 family molecular chaperone IbpA
MDRRRGAATREFEDFNPVVQWKLGDEVEDQDVVEISLPGFCKDQVRVQVDNQGVLCTTGEQPARGGRWARFKKDLCPTGPVR